MTPTFLVIALTSACTSALERTSSLASVAFFRPLSFFTSRSVAITFAPSARNACAIPRPIPCPAAVTSAILPFSRPANLKPPLWGGVGRRQTGLLPPVFIEVRRIKPALERSLAGGPLAVEDREPGGVAVLSLHDLVLAEQAFVFETKTLCRALGRFVAIVALPLEPAVAR